jgi:pimeloyl-ACP methyl ester carboxylesterase
VGNWFNNGIAAKMVDTNRVIGIDMRGHGLSEAGDRSKMASDVLEFMAQQKIEKAHIGGYSMGGGITLRLMTSNPEKFITAHFGGSGITEVADWRDKVPADKTGEAPMEAKARAAYQAVQAARGAARGEEVGNNAAALRARAAAAGTAAPTAAAPQPAAVPRPAPAAATAPSVDLKSIKFPVIAVNGDYDRPFAKTHRMWRELDNFTSVVLKDHGHLSAVMAGITPPEYADSLDKFITANNPKK